MEGGGGKNNDAMIEQIAGALAGGISAVGGIELFKWLFTRKEQKRKADAEADQSEFATLRETLLFLQDQLKLKEERFAEQTKRVRELTDENLRLTRSVAMLELERSIKLCERKNCPNREPYSGY